MDSKTSAGAWFAIGMGIGTAVGVALGNLALGLGVGMAIGAGLAVSIGRNARDGDVDHPDDPHRTDESSS